MNEASFTYGLELVEVEGNDEKLPKVTFDNFEVLIEKVDFPEIDENSDEEGNLTIQYKILSAPDDYDEESLVNKIGGIVVDIMNRIVEHLEENVQGPTAHDSEVSVKSA
ncbi:MAG: hypothetical protein D6732_02800 [Methanobacteriota archaeon]|nr:MAG: hypothetical protein D6732_02800 [Euryarchaeota archaeon]